MARLRHRKLNSIQKRIAFDGIDFVINKFMPRLYHKLDIMLVGDDTLLKNEGIRGDVDALYEDYGYSQAFRDFVVRIDTTMPLGDFMRTLFHEMVHVKQYAKKEFKAMANEDGVYRWNGQRIDTNKIDYWDEPWEIEALGREEGLLYQFLDANPDWKKFIF